MLAKITFIVFGEKWTAYLHDSEKYEDRFGEDSEAITVSQKTSKFREVHFNVEDFSEVVVRHEIYHIYHTNQYITSAHLKDHQMEEVGAELFGIRGKEMVKLADKLYKYFKKQI